MVGGTSGQRKFIQFNMTSHSKNKKLRPGTCSPAKATEALPQHFTHFWVVQGTDPANHLSETGVFTIEKGFHALLGCEPKNITSLRSGDLLVEITTPKQAKIIEKMTTLYKTPVKATPHRSLNTCKGIVRHPHLKSGSEEDLNDGLKSIASNVHRYKTIRDGKKVPTGTVCITFKTPDRPDTVKIGYLKVPVETFIPNPLRCFKCQRYGHGQTSCRRDIVCAKCAGPGHDDKSCQASKYKCHNCEGEHSASSRSCPLYGCRRKRYRD